jgi:hypothetical protein
MRGAGRGIDQHASVPLRRVHAGEVRWEKFLYELKAGPAGGRLRRPSSAGNAHRRRLNSLSPTAQKPRSGLCKQFPPHASNAHCPFRTNGAGYPGRGSVRAPLHNEGGHCFQDGAA